MFLPNARVGTSRIVSSVAKMIGWFVVDYRPAGSLDSVRLPPHFAQDDIG